MDALNKAGFALTLATEQGKTPLSLALSVDPDFVDPVQQYNVNPPEVVKRVREIYAKGEWDHPVTIDSVSMDDYDAIVVVGGPGSPLDLAGNPKVHRLLEKAYVTNKTIGTLCYAVGALVWARNPSDWNRSIIYGKQVAAHPKEWDFTGPLPYPLDGATPDNPGTDLVTPGFVYPLSPIVVDAVGPQGKVHSNPAANRENPRWCTTAVRHWTVGGVVDCLWGEARRGAFGGSRAGGCLGYPQLGRRRRVNAIHPPPKPCWRPH